MLQPGLSCQIIGVTVVSLTCKKLLAGIHSQFADSMHRYACFTRSNTDLLISLFLLFLRDPYVYLPGLLIRSSTSEFSVVKTLSFTLSTLEQFISGTLFLSQLFQLLHMSNLSLLLWLRSEHWLRQCGLPGSKYKLLVAPPNFMPVDTPQAILENNQNLTDRIVG